VAKAKEAACLLCSFSASINLTSSIGGRATASATSPSLSLLVFFDLWLFCFFFQYTKKVKG